MHPVNVDVVAGVHADRVPEPLQQGASEDEACSVFEVGRVSLPNRWRVPSLTFLWFPASRSWS
jgi:hypothetical protein